jgi:hypothetical protein
VALPYDDDILNQILAGLGPRDQALRAAVLARLRQSQTPAADLLPEPPPGTFRASEPPPGTSFSLGVEPPMRETDNEMSALFALPARTTTPLSSALPTGTIAQQIEPTPVPQTSPETFTEEMGRRLTTGPPDRLMRAWWEAGPQTAAQGAQEMVSTAQQQLQQGQPIARGTYAPGFNKFMAGAGLSMLPAAAPTMAAAPGMAALGALGGMATTLGGQGIASRLGATPEQAEAVGNITGFLDPTHLALPALKLAAGAPFAPSVVQSVMRRLPSELQPKLVRALVAHPEVKDALKWLHPQELAEFGHMTPEAQAHFARVTSELPSQEFFGAVARGGLAKKGWYQFSRSALDHMFGADAGLFAGILASTSPQTSVESNLTNALNIYKNWTAAGRPTDRNTILQIMARSVQGGGTEASLLPAWINNTVDVLQGAQSISGPKVDSFWTNLRSRARQTPHGPMRADDAVTLDAWMGNVLSMAPTEFSGTSSKPQALRGAPGYSPGYLATTAKMRESATAAGLTPAEMQETMWSWAMALYEQARTTGMSAVDIIKNHQLSPQAISGTPDFSTLFHQPQYQQIIQGMDPAIAARLQRLSPAQFATPGPITAIDQQWQLDAARRLDELLASRRMTTQTKVGTTTPGTVNVVATQEAMPGRSTGVAPELKTETQGVRDRIARRLLGAGEDLAGRSLPIKATGQPTAASTIGVGYWKPRGKAPEFNTLRASTVQAPLVITPEGQQALDPAVRASVDFAERTRAFTDAQMAAAYHGVVYDQPVKDSLHVATPRKLAGADFEGLARLFPASKYAVANTGEYINVLRFDGQPLAGHEEQLLENYLRGLDPTVDWQVKRATNVGGGFSLAPSGKWKNRPDRPVTQWGTGGFEALPAAEQAAYDSDAMKAMWGRKYTIMADLKARGYTMPDAYLNALKILSEGGMSALRKAIGDPNQLLPILVLAGVARAAYSPQSTPTSARIPPAR